MADFAPLHFLPLPFAGWVDRNQRKVVEYLLAEHRVLMARLEGRRLNLTDDQRRFLAAHGVAFGCELLAKLETTVRLGERRRTVP